MRRVTVITFLLICLCLFSACESKIQFEESSDEGNTIYKRDGIEIRISKNLEDGEGLFRNIAELVNTLQNVQPIEQLNIVVSDKVSKPNYDYEIKAQPDTLYSSDFVKELIARSYGLYDNWMIEGLYGVVLGKLNETSPYYDKEADELYGGTYFPKFFKGMQFSLFGGRFFEDLSNPEEVTYMKQAAGSLMDHLIKQGILERLIRGGLKIEDIIAWAEQHEINLDYYNTIYESTKGLRVSKPDLGYLLIESSREEGGFTINIVSEGPDYDSAYKIETMLNSFEEGIEENLAVIKAKAPQFFDEYQNVLTRVPHISYYLDKTAPSNYADKLKITLRNLPAHIVEYNHVLFDEAFESKDIATDRSQWLAEGLDGYMGIVLIQREDGILENVTRDSLIALTEEDRKKYGARELELWGLQQDLVRANFSEEELDHVDLLSTSDLQISPR